MPSLDNAILTNDRRRKSTTIEENAEYILPLAEKTTITNGIENYL